MAAPIASRVGLQIKPILLRSLKISEQYKQFKCISMLSESVCYHSKIGGHLDKAFTAGLFCQRSGGPGTSITVKTLSFRSLSSEAKDHVSDQELKKKIDELTDEFMEARDLLSDARESKGTVYFSDDLADAKEAVEGTLDAYDSLLKELNSQQTQHVLRSIGLKMQELGAQLKMIEDDLLE